MVRKSVDATSAFLERSGWMGIKAPITRSLALGKTQGCEHVQDTRLGVIIGVWGRFPEEVIFELISKR